MKTYDRVDPGLFLADGGRYDSMKYRRCGRSGILLPAISLGMWHNFGGIDNFENSRAIARHAFDRGITHFDLANNYGPPYGSAEETFGSLLRKDFTPYRDQMIISTKAGYDMWEGPYGNMGSRKYLIASLDQSLKRMGLEYVDIFYHHRPDPETPVEETMLALDQLVRQGKALYAGISNYDAEQTSIAASILKELKTPFLIHQVRYSLLDRRPENGLIPELEKAGAGLIAFSPLAQGILSDRYLHGIPAGSRASKPSAYLDNKMVEPLLPVVRALNDIANNRGQSLSQMAISWLLEKEAVTSVLVGVSTIQQLENNLGAIDKIKFTQGELDDINTILLTLSPQKVENV